MAHGHEFLGEELDNPLDPAIQPRRHSLCKRSNLGNSHIPKPSPCQPGNSYTSANAAVLIQIKFFEAPVAHDATHDGAVLLLHPCLFVLAGLSHGRAAVAGHLMASGV